MVIDIASRRRRRATGPSTAAGRETTTTIRSDTEVSNGDYYHDDDSDSASKKGHEEKMFRGACSFGQFVLNRCLYLLEQGKRCWASIRRKIRFNKPSLPCSNGKTKDRLLGTKMDLVEYFLIAGIAALSLICLVCLFPGVLRIFDGPRQGRWATDEEVNRIPLEIPLFDFGRRKLDIGGWQYFHHFFIPRAKIQTTLDNAGLFGGLEFVGPFGQARVTRPDEELVAEAYLEMMHNSTRRVAVAYEHTEEIQDVQNPCQRSNWMQAYKPLCNAMHEIDLSFDFNEERAGLGDNQIFDSFYISHGYWRDVWVVHQRDMDVKSILKKSRWNHRYNSEVFYMTLNDALVMERLTKSPRVVDVYGHCGYSVWVEAIPYEIESVIVPGNGFSKQEDLRDEEELKPKNDYTDEEKLSIALTMAESLADLHGFEDGLIIHDDVQLCQWLQTKDGRLKLGDFNRAEFPLFDPENQEYCKYDNGHAYGNYRSPEEFSALDLDEKIDVWSFGNNIYALLTGLWVFYENEDDAVVQKKVTGGEIAFIDDRYRTKSFITKNLVEVMEKCWRFNPDDRIDIFEAVRLLRETKTEYERMKAAGEINVESAVK